MFSFFALNSYKIGLDSVCTDFVISQHRWARFITKLQSDWTEFILYVGIPQFLPSGVTYAYDFPRGPYC